MSNTIKISDDDDDSNARRVGLIEYFGTFILLLLVSVVGSSNLAMADV